MAGAFIHAAEEREFKARIAQPDIADDVDYAGFVAGEKKTGLLRDCDCLCFPTYYHAESFGLVVVEAMAAGMTVVTTRWRAIPELLSADYPGYVPVRSPASIAAALLPAMAEDGTSLRELFVNRFTEPAHLEALRKVLVAADPAPR